MRDYGGHTGSPDLRLVRIGINRYKKNKYMRGNKIQIWIAWTVFIVMVSLLFIGCVTNL
jgi:hypothetical protein